MSPRSRSRLFTFALAASVAALCAGPAPGMVDETNRGPNAAVAAVPKPTKGERAVEIALDAVGTPYRWG